MNRLFTTSVIVAVCLAFLYGCGSSSVGNDTGPAGDGAIADGSAGPDAADAGGVADAADAAGPADAWPADSGAGDDTGAVDSGTDGGASDGGLAAHCPITVTYHPAKSVASVALAGEFNAWSTTANVMSPDGSGGYETLISLLPGTYAYKFVVDTDWIMDPANPYRVYSNGVESSGLRVPDCHLPRLVVDSAGGTRPSVNNGIITAQLHYEARSAGVIGSVSGELRNGRSTRALTGAELQVSGTSVTVSLTGLADGKYTVKLEAVDKAGAHSEPVLLPVWIEPEAFEWNDGLIYMVFTDRFRDGDPTNNKPVAGICFPTANFYGGDLEGVTAALKDGYFNLVGARAIWLSPFNKAPDDAYVADDGVHYVSGYHGYWPVDPNSVDSRLGGEAALQEMVEEAHKRGIRILMDLTLKNVHELHPYVTSHPGWFITDGCICGTAGCDWTEHRLDCMFSPYLPDVKWENRDANAQFLDDAADWMEKYDLDGFRIDKVRYMPDSTVFNLGTVIREKFEQGGTRVFITGETGAGWCADQPPDGPCNGEQYGAISRYIGPYGLSGQMDFVLYYAAAQAFLADQAARGMLHVDYWTRQSQLYYPKGSVMTPFIGSYDLSRYITLASDPGKAGSRWGNLPAAPSTDEPYDRMYLALAWLMAVPGAPLLYQGDEYGEFGGLDPDNRHLMRFSAQLATREQNQLSRVRKLGQARAQLKGLRGSDYATLLATETFLSVARGAGDDLVIVALNKSASSQSVSVPIPPEIASNGRTFTDALGSAIAPTVTGGALQMTLPARSAVYLK
jgi:glycosidase